MVCDCFVVLLWDQITNVRRIFSTKDRKMENTGSTSKPYWTREGRKVPRSDNALPSVLWKTFGHPFDKEAIPAHFAEKGGFESFDDKTS